MWWLHLILPEMQYPCFILRAAIKNLPSYLIPIALPPLLPCNGDKEVQTCL